MAYRMPYPHAVHHFWNGIVAWGNFAALSSQRIDALRVVRNKGGALKTKGNSEFGEPLRTGTNALMVSAGFDEVLGI